jgi:hypothetical protein
LISSFPDEQVSSRIASAFGEAALPAVSGDFAVRDASHMSSEWQLGPTLARW